jgi:hypothetical protein
LACRTEASGVRVGDSGGNPVAVLTREKRARIFARLAPTEGRLIMDRTKPLSRAAAKSRGGRRINRVGAILAAVLAASAIASVTAPGAADAAVADASCAGPPTGVENIGDAFGPRWGETFSPVSGGFLSEVRLFVQEQAHLNDTLKVEITPVNSSDASPVFPVAPLATATVADGSLTPNPTSPYLVEVAFDFPNPPAVLASSEYAIVLTRTDTSGLPSGLLGIGIVGPPDPCPKGKLYRGSATANPWTPLPTEDAVFTTFVGPPPPAAAAATGKRAAALAKCKKKHSHKAKKKCKKKAKLLPV